MAAQMRNVSIGVNTDGPDLSRVGVSLQSNGDAAVFADPPLSGSGGTGIVLARGVAPIGAPAHSAAATASVGRNDATGQNSPGIVYTGTYVNGIVLSDPATQNPATVAAGSFVSASYGPAAIFGAPGYSWTVTNLGTVNTTAFSPTPSMASIWRRAGL
jgi:hypothetical protein